MWDYHENDGSYERDEGYHAGWFRGFWTGIGTMAVAVTGAFLLVFLMGGI